MTRGENIGAARSGVNPRGHEDYLCTPEARGFLRSRGVPYADQVRDKQCIELVSGLRTRTGKPREERLRQCRQPILTISDAGAVKSARLLCRDRACVHCQGVRSEQNAEILKHYIHAATENGREFLFVTLTRPKSYRLDDAAEEMAEAWRRFVYAGDQEGRDFRRIALGGYRGVETVWRVKGEKVGSYTVKKTGWHLHFHLLIEVPRYRGKKDRRDAWMKYCGRRIIERWLEASPESKVQAQDAQDVDDEKIEYVCKYITKGVYELPRNRGREWAAVVSSRRLCQAWGSMYGRLVYEGGKVIKGAWRKGGMLFVEVQERRMMIPKSVSTLVHLADFRKIGVPVENIEPVAEFKVLNREGEWRRAGRVSRMSVVRDDDQFSQMGMWRQSIELVHAGANIVFVPRMLPDRTMGGCGMISIAAYRADDILGALSFPTREDDS